MPVNKVLKKTLTLKNLKHTKADSKLIYKVINDADSLPDLDSVLRCFSAIEILLENCLKAKFLNGLSKNQVDEYFNAGGTASGAERKIKLCHSFKIITDEMYADLNIIKEVRNSFAHLTMELDFNEQHVVGTCNQLKLFTEQDCEDQYVSLGITGMKRVPYPRKNWTAIVDSYGNILAAIKLSDDKTAKHRFLNSVKINYILLILLGLEFYKLEWASRKGNP